jgi:hypothetical protein
MMDFKRISYTAIAAVFIAAAGFGLYKTVYADTSTVTPGSTEDPIVTKSYVDQKIAELLKQESGGNVGNPESGDKSGNAGSNALEVVTVPFGKKIMVNAGGELVVRVGKAVAYSPDPNGLSDLTAGTDIPTGKAVPTNHLILFPRDGRGVEPDPNQKNGLTVLVRGGYKLE